MKNLKTKNLLDLIPKTKIKWELNEKKLITLIVPRFKNRLMTKLAVRLGKSENLYVHLDEEGSRAWQQIDGHRTVEEIGILSGFNEKENVQNEYERLAEFLSSLIRNDFIYFEKE